MSKMLVTSNVNNYEMCNEIFAPVREYRYSRETIQKCPALARNLWRVYALDDWKSGKVYPFYDWDFDEIRIMLYSQKGSVWIKYKTMRQGKEVRAVCALTNVSVEEAIELLNIIDEHTREEGGCEE